MKIGKVISRYFSLLSLSVAVLTACGDINETGLGIRPDQDVVVVCSDTFHIDCENYCVPAISAQADTMVLGEFYSPSYGTTKAELLLQLAAPEGYTFPDASYNPQPDSLVLLMYYNSYFGSPYSPLEISIYEMNKGSIDYSTRYYSDINPGDYCDSSILMGKRVMTSIDLTPKDSSFVDMDGKSGTLGYVRYKFDDTQLNRFFNVVKKNPSITTDEFLKDFKGLYVTTRYGNSTLIYLNQVTMYLYYHYTYKRAGNDTIVKTSIAFPANHEVRQLNHFVHPNREEVVENIPDSLIYIKSAAGIFPKATIPLGKIYEAMHSKMDTTKVLNISAAELTFECIEYDEADVYMNPPTYLLAIEEDKFDEFLRTNKSSTGYETDRVLGLYNSVKEAYCFDLTYMLTKQLRVDSMEVDKTMNMILVPVEETSDGSSVSRLRPLVKLAATKVRSNKNEYSPLRLKVLYEGF